MTDTIDQERNAEPGGASGGTADLTPQQQRQSVLTLLAVVAGVIALGWWTGTLATVAVIGAFILMIMLHELGHFATAKWSGMKVTEYFLGFGPRLWSIRRGETEYGVKAIPAGGYVKIVGMHNLDKVEDPADEPRTYRQQPFWQRLSVVVAGSAMHFIIAFILLYSLNAFVGFKNYDQPLLEVGSIATLDGGSPAQEAGLQPGDEIVSVDGNEFASWDELPPYIRERPGEELQFVIERDGERLTRTVVPVARDTVDPATGEAGEPTGFVGIGPAFPTETYGLVDSLGRTVDGFWELTTGTITALGNIFSPSGVADYFDILSGNPPPPGEGGENRFLSPVGFARVADQAVDSGLFNVLSLLVLINVFVGIFNLVPLLPLDGGHVAIAVYEAIRSKISGRRHFVDVTKLMPATYMVFMLLVFIGVTSLWLDIVDPIQNPFQ